MADAGIPVGFGFGVDDQASKPLSQIESAYVDLMSSMDKVMKQTSKVMDKYSDKTERVTDVVEKAGKEETKKTTKLGEAGSALKKNIVGVDKLGISWKKFTDILTAVSVVGVVLLAITAVVKLVKFFKSFGEEALKLRREVARLNETYAMNAKEARVVTSTLRGLDMRAGRTREEVGQLVKTMLDLAFLPGKGFKKLTRDILDFSSATGISVDSAAKFADQLIHIDRLPTTAVRRLGLGIKYIADITRTTTDELIGFHKTLEPLFKSIPDLSGEAKVKLTSDYLSIKGALDDAGLSAEKAIDGLTLMLSPAKEGIEALGMFSKALRMDPRDLRALIESDPAKIFDMLSKRAVGSRQELLQLSYMTKSIGMDFKDLGRISEQVLSPEVIAKATSKLKELGVAEKEISDLRKKGEEGGIGYFKFQALAAEKTLSLEKGLAEAAAKRQETYEAAMNRLAKVWKDIKLTIGTALIKTIEGTLVPALHGVAKWLEKVKWNVWIPKMVRDLKIFGSLMGDFLKGLIVTLNAIPGIDLDPTKMRMERDPAFKKGVKSLADIHTGKAMKPSEFLEAMKFAREAQVTGEMEAVSEAMKGFGLKKTFGTMLSLAYAARTEQYKNLDQQIKTALAIEKAGKVTTEIHKEFVGPSNVVDLIKDQPARKEEALRLLKTQGIVPARGFIQDTRDPTVAGNTATTNELLAELTRVVARQSGMSVEMAGGTGKF